MPTAEAAPPPRTTRSALLWFLAPFAVFGMLGLLWALASPIFSVPDENAHATKAIAQVRGQVIGYTLPDVRHIIVDLPAGYEYSPEMLCFVPRSAEPASCAPALGDPGGQDWFNTWVGAYNPVYYQLVGWPSLVFDGNTSIYAMRIASVLLCAALLAWAFQVAALGARQQVDAPRRRLRGSADERLPDRFRQPERSGTGGGRSRLGRGPAPARVLRRTVGATTAVEDLALGRHHGRLTRPRERAGAGTAVAGGHRGRGLPRGRLATGEGALHHGRELPVARD